MNSKTQKGLKPLVINMVVIAMSICYVVGPSHNELNKLLHILTHQLEMPDSVLSHSKTFHLEQEAHDVHQVTSHSYNHQHSFLEFLDKVLEASNAEHNNENTTIIPHKIDKHLKTEEVYKKQQFLWISTNKHTFSVVKKNTQRGFLNGVFQPPRLS